MSSRTQSQSHSQSQSQLSNVTYIDNVGPSFSSGRNPYSRPVVYDEFDFLCKLLVIGMLPLCPPICLLRPLCFRLTICAPLPWLRLPHRRCCSCMILLCASVLFVR
jgi:hypothetical protein